MWSKEGWAIAAQERVLPERMTYGIVPASKTQSSRSDGRKLNDSGWKLERPLPLIDQCADGPLHFDEVPSFQWEWLHDERGRKLRELVSDSWAGRGPTTRGTPGARFYSGRPLWDVVGAGQRTRLSWRTSAQSAASMRSERRVSSQAWWTNHLYAGSSRDKGCIFLCGYKDKAKAEMQLWSLLRCQSCGKACNKADMCS